MAESPCKHEWDCVRGWMHCFRCNKRRELTKAENAVRHYGEVCGRERIVREIVARNFDILTDVLVTYDLDRFIKELKERGFTVSLDGKKQEP